MTTLHGLILRTTVAGLICIALGAFSPFLAAAQTTEPAAASETNASIPAATGKDAPAAAPLRDGAVADHAASKSDGASAGASTASTSEDGAPSDKYTISASLKNPESPIHTGDPAFDHASDSFPAFCKDWQRRLHDRELNNVENISWKDQNGWKTGTYLAYSPVKSCSCKRSTGGVPIGELTYQETEEYLAGRTVEEARHSQPKAVGVTNTTEIFRWDKTKWDDGR